MDADDRRPEVTIEIPGNFKGKDLDVKIAKGSVKAGIKGQDAIIEVRNTPTRLPWISW